MKKLMGYFVLFCFFFFLLCGFPGLFLVLVSFVNKNKQTNKQTNTPTLRPENLEQICAFVQETPGWLIYSKTVKTRVKDSALVTSTEPWL